MPHEHVSEYDPTPTNEGVRLAVTGKGEAFAVLVKLGSAPWVSLSAMVAAELAEKLEAILYEDKG